MQVSGMELKELQEKIVANAKRYGEVYDIEIDEEFVALKLFEEVGEYAQSILIHHKKSRPEKHLPFEESKQEVAKELADVVGMALVSAEVMDIDLFKALEEKWLKE
jgi:NTP pyrophosphatase (non-canonical NTP hydrolase)